jgi:RHS repeat-associated protein
VNKGAPPAYNANNRVTWTTVNSAVSGFTYDAAGDIDKDSVNQYAYDGEGRICAVENLAAGSITQYIYDAQGTRVAKGTAHTVLVNGQYVLSCDTTQNGFTATALYTLGPSGEQLTETDGQGNWQHTNVYAAGSLIATYRDTNTYFDLTDWLGTKRAEVSATNSCGTGFLSYPYGDALAPVPLQGYSTSCVDATEHHFTGKERDAESGNDYFGARYYASSMGRFLSPDWAEKLEGADPVPYAKLDDPQSLNLYAYVTNNPLTDSDSNGHSTDTYVPDLDKHGGAHVDRYNKAGQNVGRYRLDGTPMKHGTKTPKPVPNSDKKKFQKAADKAQEKLQEREQNQQNLVPKPPPAPDPKPGPQPTPCEHCEIPIPFPRPRPCPGCEVPLPFPNPPPLPFPEPLPIPEPIPIFVVARSS